MLNKLWIIKATWKEEETFFTTDSEPLIYRRYYVHVYKH